jgi:hypothetical protein
MPAPRDVKRRDDWDDLPPLDSERDADFEFSDFSDEEAITTKYARPLPPFGTHVSLWEEADIDEILEPHRSTPPPPRASSSNPPPPLLPSQGPVAFDIEPAPPAFPVDRSVRIPPALRTRTVVAVAATMMAALAILDVSLVMRRAHRAPAAAHVATATASAMIAIPPAPPPSEAVSAAPVATPPIPVPTPLTEEATATTGTILGAPAHRLYVDGHLAAGYRAVVTCGEHHVKIGARGATRTVNVPCGETVNVAP